MTDGYSAMGNPIVQRFVARAKVMFYKHGAAFLAVFVSLSGCDSTGTPSAGSTPYLERRAAFHTSLKAPGPSPQQWQNEPLPDGLQPVTYPSNGRDLKAWLFVPNVGDSKKPALVYIHGGFAFGVSDFEEVRPFADSGFIVLCPALRGENGNAGDFEFTLGEVDDAVAAVRWLAEQDNVDSRRIYAFGHSSGGIASAMLSLMDDVPIRHSGSSGGLYGTDLFAVVARQTPARVPFALADPQEAQLRVLVGNIRWMKRPHYAICGTGDSLMKVRESRREAAEAKAPLEVIEIPGDHHSSLNAAVLRYLAIAQQDK